MSYIVFSLRFYRLNLTTNHNNKYLCEWLQVLSLVLTYIHFGNRKILVNLTKDFEDVDMHTLQLNVGL